MTKFLRRHFPPDGRRVTVTANDLLRRKASSGRPAMAAASVTYPVAGIEHFLFYYVLVSICKHC
jgi:hypothetical protein